MVVCVNESFAGMPFLRFPPVPKEREELAFELNLELEFEFEDGVSPARNAEHRLLEIEEPLVELDVLIRPSTPRD